jgi:uncharacterized repeat protein (TIGR03803 family)
MRKVHETRMIGGALAATLTLLILGDPASASAETHRTLYLFNGALPSPLGGVVIGADGVLYGATFDGGPSGSGTVFSLTPPASAGGKWTESELAAFGSEGPVGPVSGVAIGPGGVLYGTSYAGGAQYEGTVFSITPPASSGGAWTESVVYSFLGSGALDGGQPWAGVAIGQNGELYGTTVLGGGGDFGGDGIIYELTPPSSAGGTWTETILSSFPNEYGFGPPLPYGGVVIGSGGVLYGVTYGAGRYGAGSVYSLTPPLTGSGAWTMETLYSFTGKGDGWAPYGGLVIDTNGVLYGTTMYGGSGTACANGCGVAFSLTPSDWTETVLITSQAGAMEAIPRRGFRSARVECFTAPR